MEKRLKLGKWGENLACDFLVKHDFEIVDKNYYCQDGEIDIIAKKDQNWWFIEVKTRRSLACGEPEEAFDQEKEEKMEQAILRYLSDKEIEIEAWQMGLVSVKVIGRKKVRIRFLVI